MTSEERLKELGLFGPGKAQLQDWLNNVKILEINCSSSIQMSEADTAEWKCSKILQFNFNKELPGRNLNLLLQFNLTLQG